MKEIKDVISLLQETEDFIKGHKFKPEYLCEFITKVRSIKLLSEDLRDSATGVK